MIKRFTKNEDEIVSIFNDGMLRVFTQLDMYTGTGNFEGWVRRVVLNSLSNYFRKYNVKVKIFELQEYDLSNNAHYNNDNGILDGLYYNDLLKMLKVLPKRSSKIFKMHVLDGYSHKEIAEELEISVGTSKWHVFKAKEKLMESIKY